MIVILLLTLTAVTLISQRQRTVLLNQQLAALVGEATVALHGAAPLLGAVPTRSSTIKSRANSAAHLVSETRPLVSDLTSTGFPATVAAIGQFIASLQQQGTLRSTLASVGRLADDANRSAVITRLGKLLGQVPAASMLIGQFSALATAAQRYQLVHRAASGLDNVSELVRLQRQALSVERATLNNGRMARGIAKQTLTAAQTTLATAQQILTVAEQTLAHAASLDRKVGPVP